MFSRFVNRLSGSQALRAWGVSVVSALTLWASPAAAQLMGDTLGAIICNVQFTGNTYPNMLAATCYIAGAIIILRGGLMMKKYSDAPGQMSAAVPIWHLIGGACLISIPIFAGIMQRSLFGSLASGGPVKCNPGAVGGGGGAVGLDVMMKSFVDNIHGPIFALLAILSFIVGLTYLVAALLKAVKIGSDPRAGNPKDIIVYLVIGSILISMGEAVPMMITTLFGGGGNVASFPMVAWSKVTGSAGNTAGIDTAITAILRFIQIVGGISFVRGWLLIKKAVEGGQATIPQGATHIIGGVMAINIGQMLKVFEATFGVSLLQ